LNWHSSSLNFGPLKFFLTKLVTPGADIDLATDAGRTALHYTASKGRRAIAETLIARHANVNKKDKVCKLLMI
jgi:ankyrin repeat protein